MNAVKDFSTAARIVETVADHFSVSLGDIEGHCREWRFVWPRWVAIALVRRRTGFSLGQIAAIFNRAGHYSIIAAVRGLENQIQTNRKYAAEFAAVESRI